MLKSIVANLRACWSTLIVSDLLFKAVTFVLLTPIISLLFRLFLFASGRTVLADADIARFLLHPLGWLTFVIIGGAMLGVFVLEQAVMMTVCIGADKNLKLQPTSVLLFVAASVWRLFWLTSRIVAHLGILVIPFLAAGGAIFWLLLTDHDINFYLTHKPPKFWIAVTLIGSILAVMATLILRKLTDWIFAPQLLLYENLSPLDALRESRNRAQGHRFTVGKSIFAWAVVNILISFAVSVLVITVGQWFVAQAGGSLWILVVAVGTVMLLAGFANLATNMLANASCGSLMSLLYLRLVAPEQVSLPASASNVYGSFSAKLTRGRVLTGVAVAVLIAAALGASAIHGYDLEDRIEITAHRGGAGVAPENTLAAFRQAIQDKTDWIEIDVQESKDGVVMVAHDSDLAKVARNPIKIWAATAEELKSVDIGKRFDARFAGEHVPTLEEVLQMARGKVRVNIELKYYGHTQDLENRVIELVERFGMESEIVVMSLESKGIEKVKRLRPTWTVGLLTAVAAGDLTRANADFLAVKSSIATRSFVESAHRRSKSVSAWTVNDRYAMSAMISRGVDNLITDYPALAREVLAEREAMSPLERLMVEVAFYLGAARIPQQ